MNRKAVALVVLVFVLGLALGALSMYVAGNRIFAGERGRNGPARVVERLTSELALTAEQQKRLTAILEETNGKYRTIYDQMRPQMEEIRQQGRQKIRGILTQEQLPKFEEWLRRVDEERRKRGPR